ncbi:MULTISPECIES: sensor histidine kinase [unclassified Crossiella]|uniref:sensor histidine kinase n=1 Tax=unclassified Crossiella TaxID=2620835 RepID=UPI001FFE3853|nr:MULTISPECIES: sensor histidine kinase [unclassified Crossiella]MCK2237065.1 sensor histidine kinase [Crossiella sp. S99.2]MCK2250733.1 sensor histidine kinase [Crossiella sp. S99.1]
MSTPLGWRPPRPLQNLSARQADLLVVVIVLLAVELPLGFGLGGGPPPWWGYLVAASTALPLLFRRQAPMLTMIAVSVAELVYIALDLPDIWSIYGPLVGVYTVSRNSEPLIRRITLALALLAVVVHSGLDQMDFQEFTFLTTCSVTAYLVGWAVRTNAAYTVALEERAHRLEQEQQLEAERATSAERARIARDMHDILSHAVALIVVQAESGPLVVRADPARAEASFDAIATAGRDAMAQLRRLLGMVPRDPAELRRAPQPTMDDVPRMIETVRATGLHVEHSVSGAPAPLPPDTELAVYRLIQEALTNTVRHARAGRAEVRLSWSRAELAVLVLDDGIGADSPAPGRGGRGLVGIRERVGACGGVVRIGPREGGGFMVTAEIPLAHKDFPVSRVERGS